ncbi:bZIP transcription factor 11 [Manihot esculenta]|uniref:BZIP domain-containing protein n=1 Tax=Manihot esculenta TaxID=3983 RepID=A0A2C9WCF4_MANES|nr:bZIP transcription factor 11 [Manihot esculenta]OAY57450.1 hypothetical protein MANES_02G097900v8 [Manihot esculenta]
MVSSSGASSGSIIQRKPSSEEDLQQIMDQRKRKRMLSNREAARRSRMKKQKRLDDLMSQLDQLEKENNEIFNNICITSQLLLNVEAKNSILIAQVDELSHRLESLNEIVNYVNFSNGLIIKDEYDDQMIIDDYVVNPWINSFHVNQPIMDMALF